MSQLMLKYVPLFRQVDMYLKVVGSPCGSKCLSKINIQTACTMPWLLLDLQLLGGMSSKFTYSEHITCNVVAFMVVCITLTVVKLQCSYLNVARYGHVMLIIS